MQIRKINQHKLVTSIFSNQAFYLNHSPKKWAMIRCQIFFWILCKCNNKTKSEYTENCCRINESELDIGLKSESITEDSLHCFIIVIGVALNNIKPCIRSTWYRSSKTILQRWKFKTCYQHYYATDSHVQVT